MKIEEQEVVGLVKLPVIISGDWIVCPQRDWRGVTIAAEPIIAVVFLESEGRVVRSFDRPDDRTVCTSAA